MNVDVIIQARMGSSRLPGKILKPLCGMPILQHIVERVSACKNIRKIIVATTNLSNDDVTENLCKEKGYNCYRGKSEDVLDRFYQCAKVNCSDVIVRMTADNVLFDSQIIDDGIKWFIQNDKDYIYYGEGLPLGTAVEIFNFASLKKAWEEAKDTECREHVTVYMYRNEEKFRCDRIRCSNNEYSDIRLTMDTETDYHLIKIIYEYLFAINKSFTIFDVIEFLENRPDLKKINASIPQNVVTYKKNEKSDR